MEDQLNEANDDSASETALDDVQQFLAENPLCPTEVASQQEAMESNEIARIQASLLDSPPSPTESKTSTSTESLSSSADSCCLPRLSRRPSEY